MRPTLSLLSLLALAAPAAASQVTLGASKDNTLYSSNQGLVSNGLGEFFFVGRNGGQAAYPIRRGVIAFDVAGAIPRGSSVTSVRLVLSLSQTIAGPQTVSVHRLTKDWGEGTSDAPGSEGAGDASTPGDATWAHTFYPSSFWSSLGGDFVASASASLSVDQVGFYTWGSTPQLVADVQAWVNAPTQNFGWLLKGNEASSTTAKRFDSKDSPFPSIRPALIVDFLPPPPPPATYCTSKLTSSGCVPAIGWSGVPSASAGSGFVVSTAQVEPNNLGIFFYGKSGPAALPFQGGFLCVQPPTLRTPATSSGPGGPCGGTYSIDFNAYAASGADPALVAGTAVNLQTWFRDPPNPAFGTGLSDGLAFTLAP